MSDTHQFLETMQFTSVVMFSRMGSTLLPSPFRRIDADRHFMRADARRRLRGAVLSRIRPAAGCVGATASASRDATP